ncbi:MAG: hypothetical protein GY704_13285 [Phycisphaeraceae bacterium]|nr:hypothetical protein [Phycisphaeraceae bacterium]
MTDHQKHAEEVNAQTWARLPESVRRQVMARNEYQDVDQEDVAKRLLKLQLKYAVIGAILALVCSAAVGSQAWWFRGVFFIAGGVVAFRITRDRRGRVGGFIGMAGVGFAVTWAGASIGAVDVWPVLSSLGCTFLGIFGAVMGICAELEHHQHF